MNKHREKLCPLWLSILIGLGVVGGLVAAYQRDGEQTRSLALQPPSELSTAYLEAWLRVKPDSPQYLSLLGTQYIKLHQWPSALSVASRLERLGEDDPLVHQQGLLLEVAAAEQMAYQYLPDDPRRADGVAFFIETLEKTSIYQWDIPIMQSFADKARLAGAYPVMRGYYRKLALADAQNATQWHDKLASSALVDQNYDEAALAYFAAYDIATTLDTKRHYFMNALNVLVSGNQTARACEEGERRLGDLAKDHQTLVYLLNLARQVNRSDLVNRYAHELINLTTDGEQRKSSANKQQVGRSMPHGMHTIPFDNAAFGTSHWPSLMGARFYKISTNATGSGHAQDVDKAAEYELVFKAFIESNNLDEAEQVAQQALAAGIDPLVWMHRLAEVAQWNNHPKKAYDYWLLLAKTSGNEQAWDKVLELAPEFEDDAAYLTAWEHANDKQSTTDARNALLAQYMQRGRWGSALRVIETLKQQESDVKNQQRMLLLEAAAIEQQAYSYLPDDPLRSQGLDRFIQVLNQSSQYEWSVPEMSWLAQKSRDVGATALVIQYYHKLALLDLRHAAAWYQKIADMAISQQAYAEAAQAYFSAQQASDGLDQKRIYFLSALKAYVANSELDRACAEAENKINGLAQDPETLRYLIGLARQANRSDLMAKYARDLIKYSDQSQLNNYYSDYSDAANHVNYRPLGLAGLVQYVDVRMTESGRAYPLQQLAVNTNNANDITPATAEKNSDFDLAFQAFVESRQLNEAEQLAKKALDLQLDPLLWTQRLAQVAEWNNHPETALKYWLQYAKASGDDQAWAHVLKIAPQLNNDQAFLAALIHAADRTPHDMILRDKIVATYERLGQPQAGMAYLKARATGAFRQPLLKRYADLAERSGNDQAALDAYRSLLAAYPTNAIYVMHVVSLDYRKGNVEGGLAMLREVREYAGDGPESAPYWRLYAELAHQRKSKEDINFAYQHLLTTGLSNPDDLGEMTAFYDRYPIDAARTAELHFHKNESQIALRSALQHYINARAWSRVQTLFNGMSAQQRSLFESSATSLAIRAQYYLYTQRWDEALADLRLAVRMADADDAVNVLYLWTLVESGTENELKAALTQWRSAAKVNSDYWGAFAAAELRLGNAARAVTYLSQQQQQFGDDPLWLMVLADAQEAAGHTDQAWGIRRHAWNLLLSKSQSGQLDEPEKHSNNNGFYNSKNILDPLDLSDLRMARVSLSQTFANGDISRSLLIDLLKQEGRHPEERAVANSLLGNNAGLPKISEVLANDDQTTRVRQEVVNAATKEVAIAWAMSGEHLDLARAWLARGYVNQLLRPFDAELTLAMADNDQVTLNRLLDKRQGRIATSSRIPALIQTGRTSEAESAAFAVAQGSPDNTDAYETMVEAMLRDRPAVGVDVMGSRSDSLHYVKSSVVGGVKLTSRLGLNVEAIQRNQRITDTDQLTWIPAHDREVNLTLSDTTIHHDLSLTVGYRKALKSFYNAKVHGEFNRTGSVVGSVTLGFNQFTESSTELQVGAVKDMIQLGVEWNPASSWFVQATAEANRFRAQDRTRIGRGLEFSQALGYRFRSSYPDWNIRLIGAQGVYSAKDGTIPFMGVLYGGEAPLASDLMSQNFHQYGVMLGLGNAEANNYSRGWRPFMDVGYVRDSNYGWGPRINLGIGGSVLGKDYLRLYFVHESAGKGNSQRVTQVGLSYRMWF